MDEKSKGGTKRRSRGAQGSAQDGPGGRTTELQGRVAEGFRSCGSRWRAAASSVPCSESVTPFCPQFTFFTKPLGSRKEGGGPPAAPLGAWPALRSGSELGGGGVCLHPLAAVSPSVKCTNALPLSTNFSSLHLELLLPNGASETRDMWPTGSAPTSQSTCTGAGGCAGRLPPNLAFLPWREGAGTGKGVLGNQQVGL